MNFLDVPQESPRVSVSKQAVHFDTVSWQNLSHLSDPVKAGVPM